MTVLKDLDKIEISGHGPNRKVKCCYCYKVAEKSILPHVRNNHPEKWKLWRKEILNAYNIGLTPKQIMKEKFNTLFTWSVIEKEITKMIEEGFDVKPPIKNEIDKWEPNDLDLMEKLDRTTTWKFTKRGNWGTHKGSYRGNWPPQIPRYFIMKYTKPGKDIVFDGFIGGGTTIVECKLLGRNAIGYDINPFAVKMTKKHLEIIEKESKRQKFNIPTSDIKLEVHDARNLITIDDSSIDLICTHPPYFNSLKYTHNVDGDMSLYKDVNMFLDDMSLVAKEFYRILHNRKTCVILIGDVNINKKRYPLGFRVMDKFLDAGFTYKDTIIKEQYNDRSTAFYVNKNIRRISHEYLFVFQKLE